MHRVLGVYVRTYLSYPCIRLTEDAYSSTNCGGPVAWKFTYPGDATGGLSQASPWNDAIGSFKCFNSC